MDSTDKQWPSHLEERGKGVIEVGVGRQQEVEGEGEGQQRRGVHQEEEQEKADHVDGHVDVDA